MLSEKEIIETLRKEAEVNKVARAVFIVFAQRNRARSILTVGGLEQRMKANGFDYKEEEYIKLLQFLAKLDLGKLIIKSNGKIIGLKEIKIKLQSIGEVACNAVNTVEGFSPKNKYKELPVIHTQKVVPIKSNKVTLRVETDSGLTFDISIPKEATENQVSDMIKRLL